MVFFFGSLVIVVVCYKAMQHSKKRLELYLSHGCVFANALLHCYSAFELWEFSDFLFLFTAVHRLCFKFTINERQCLVPAKQGVYAIIKHDNLRQKESAWFVLQATFCVGVKTKTSD